MECASEIQSEIYTSPVQIIYAFVQILLFAATIIGSILAVLGLARKSTIPDSTRVLLVGSLFFANAHEFAYVGSPLHVFNLNLFHSNTSCYPLKSTNDCIPSTTLLATGISGNMLIQSALSMDRLLATVLPFAYSRLRAMPGLVLLFMVLVPSAFSYNWIRQDIVLDDYQLFCSNWSARISTRANTYLQYCFCLTVVHIVINVLLIWRNKVTEARCRFDLAKQYHNTETLKTTIAICYLSIAQFCAMSLYSGGVLLMRTNRESIPTMIYFSVIVWVYAPPYACVSLAPLILFSLRNLKKERQTRIQSITAKNQAETQEDHIRKLKLSWE